MQYRSSQLVRSDSGTDTAAHVRAGAGASANWYHDKDADRSQIYQVHAAATAATLALSATVAMGTIRRLPPSVLT